MKKYFWSCQICCSCLKEIFNCEPLLQNKIKKNNAKIICCEFKDLSVFVASLQWHHCRCFPFKSWWETPVAHHWTRCSHVSTFLPSMTHSWITLKWTLSLIHANIRAVYFPCTTIHFQCIKKGRENILLIIQQTSVMLCSNKKQIQFFFFFAVTLHTKLRLSKKFVPTCLCELYESPQLRRLKIVSFRKNLHVAEYCVVRMERSRGAQRLVRYWEAASSGRGSKGYSRTFWRTLNLQSHQIQFLSVDVYWWKQTSQLTYWWNLIAVANLSEAASCRHRRCGGA